ncbi:protein-L-isoaspartate O-methyltransferase [Rhabdaerophilum sp. SD176]|uniref:protein-L-isoaspartate O-methyltransferase family protein n=1 Tax=Rhabdaerophilum sp. SD176 TaxID=2983548 RepID=UPI0024DFA2AA|nr:protein-L-isoaspartate O-methyltransferase [Rhabdaerophilum sp. SD176]
MSHDAASDWRQEEATAEPGSPLSADTALAQFILDLRSRGQTDAAMLTAFERLPRHLFIPGFLPERLYSPVSLPIPCGEEATDPFSIARHLALLDIRPGHRILEIGLGSGFQAAIMARLGASVTSYERYRSLIRQAEQAFRHAGITSVTPMLGDGLARLDRPDSFDRIILNGALELPPQAFLDRLNPHGILVGHRLRGLETRLAVWRKDLTGQAAEQDAGPSRLGPLRGGLTLVL